MQLGAMNNPAGKLTKEIEWIGSSHFDFVDLTLEVNARPERIDIDRVRNLLARYQLGIIGHTPWFLPAAVEYRELI
ncbi:sugar phosphate isomerase/epimerase, partial [candidate division WOR-3 bacterium]